jgi:hypothetical protein
MIIPKPDRDPRDPDRFLTCEEALQPVFDAVVESAASSGWDVNEVLVALTSLADHAMLARSCNAETEAAIERARRGS